MPRRRRGAKAIAVDVDAERGLAMRILLHSPKDMIAGALAFAAVSAIVANALFLQAGRHPAPMFGSVTAIPAVAAANPLPRPRPVEADAASSESKPVEPRAADPLANLVKTTSAAPVAPAAAPRPPAAIPVSSHSEAAAISGAGSRRVAAVQRALTEYGYGQLKPTGTIGSDTQAAIQKFERARKLPVTGQVSDRLVRELTAMIGHPVD
jgi:Putative peptidoglycan binding domain